MRVRGLDRVRVMCIIDEGGGNIRWGMCYQRVCVTGEGHGDHG